MNEWRKFKTIAIIDVHNRDIIDKFVKENVSDSSEFQWESQLRFYWMKDLDDIEIRQCTGKIYLIIICIIIPKFCRFFQSFNFD